MPLRGLHSVHKTVALGRVVLPRRHLKLENVHVLLQAIALECGALRLIRRELFVMMPVISTIYIYILYEMQSQFGKVEEGCLNKSLLYECANFPGNLFTIMSELRVASKPKG